MVHSPVWDMRLKSRMARAKDQTRAIQTIDRKITTLMDRLIEASSETTVKAYESRLEKLEAEKAILSENIASSRQTQPGSDQSFRTAMVFLANPCSLWHSDGLEDRRTLLKLVFATPLSYARETGFRTAETTIPFTVLEGFSVTERKVVSRAGFEPATH